MLEASRGDGVAENGVTVTIDTLTTAYASINGRLLKRSPGSDEPATAEEAILFPISGDVPVRKSVNREDRLFVF